MIRLARLLAELRGMSGLPSTFTQAPIDVQQLSPRLSIHADAQAVALSPFLWRSEKRGRKWLQPDSS
jgi:hypothetical protein